VAGHASEHFDFLSLKVISGGNPVIGAAIRVVVEPEGMSATHRKYAAVGTVCVDVSLVLASALPVDRFTAVVEKKPVAGRGWIDVQNVDVVRGKARVSIPDRLEYIKKGDDLHTFTRMRIQRENTFVVVRHRFRIRIIPE
jgi:hypothetical protein